ncbi:MAG: hypothetical protein LAO31_05195 [Acidobacteriia bacterium]|nr:hypothetical protein [Terriglobia bacterium]
MIRFRCEITGTCDRQGKTRDPRKRDPGYQREENEWLFLFNFRERSTEEIGEILMKNLKKLDKVAYVRSAYVYLDFSDVTEFMGEVKELLGASVKKEFQKN